MVEKTSDQVDDIYFKASHRIIDNDIRRILERLAKVWQRQEAFEAESTKSSEGEEAVIDEIGELYEQFGRQIKALTDEAEAQGVSERRFREILSIANTFYDVLAFSASRTQEDNYDLEAARKFLIDRKIKPVEYAQSTQSRGH